MVKHNSRHIQTLRPFPVSSITLYSLREAAKIKVPPLVVRPLRPQLSPHPLEYSGHRNFFSSSFKSSNKSSLSVRTTSRTFLWLFLVSFSHYIYPQQIPPPLSILHLFSFLSDTFHFIISFLFSNAQMIVMEIFLFLFFSVSLSPISTLYLSMVRVQMASLPRLGPVVSTMGSYMQYQKDMHLGTVVPLSSRLTKKARSPAF